MKCTNCQDTAFEQRNGFTVPCRVCNPHSVYQQPLKKRWYHNGTSTFEDPQVQLRESSSVEFCEGPFDSFSAAKADMLAGYRRWRRTIGNAVYIAKKLRKPKVQDEEEGQ